MKINNTLFVLGDEAPNNRHLLWRDFAEINIIHTYSSAESTEPDKRGCIKFTGKTYISSYYVDENTLFPFGSTRINPVKVVGSDRSADGRDGGR